MNKLATNFSLAAAVLQLALISSAWSQGFGQGSGNEKINLDPLKVEGIEAPEHVAGERTELTVFFSLPDDHHAYQEQFKLEIESPSYIYISEIQISPLVDFKDPVSKKIKKGTTGQGQLKTIVQISREELARNSSLRNKSELPVNLFLTYQACTKTYCLFPKKIPLQTVMKLKAGAGSSASAPANVPAGSMLSFENALNKGLIYAFLIAFFAGILTSFTPCIFPMIPITLAVLGAQQLKGSTARPSRWRGLVLSLFYVFGIAITYSLIGVAAAKTGALFGSLLGHPAVVSAIALIFIAMALSMFGLFEVKIPDTWATKISNKFSGSTSEKNIVGAFLSGIVAGVVASPCVGPVLVSILTFVAQSQNVVLGFFLLFVFALGLGQIFIVMGTFSQLLNKLPRSGPWLNGIKYVFGVIMLLMAAYYVYPILPLEKLKGGAAQETENYLKPNWKPYSEENLQKAIAAGQPVIIDIKADWCVACKELEVKTFSHKEVHDLGKRFVWLEFDATQNSPELDVLKEKYQILGLPFVAFYSSDGKWRQDLTVTGFEGPAPFLKRMHKSFTNQ